MLRLPEPFAAAIQAGKPLAVCDEPAPTPEALYGRGLARALVGREAQARADFQAALPALGDVCGIELAFLDLRQRSSIQGALQAARTIAERAEAKSALRARALHLIGLAEGKLRRTPAALGALLEAVELYRGLGDRIGRARVYDTLGTLHAARGRLDHALNFYALSLVDKSLLDDRPGIAITLGNLGRVHLRAGRYADAIECFEMDLRLASEMGDERGQARIEEDLGRALLGQGDAAGAQERLERCLSIARHRDYLDLQFFALKDLVLAHVAQGRPREAGRALEAAEAAMPGGAEPYLRHVLDAARGEWLLADGDARAAVEVLEAAVHGFETADIPDFEIPARIALASALLARRLKATAEQCLLRGLRRARADGYARYLPALNESMARLDLVEGAVEEAARPVGTGPELPGNGYIVRERLGSGGFGEVFRVYDPERGAEVALKRLYLARVYDPAERRRLVGSARLELEAASRVRHPGVVRVLAIGTEPDGGVYIVQEMVQGQPLRRLLRGDGAADVGPLLRLLEQVAGALQALHDAGVVHRDLKPENILVRDDGSPVLVDFGIAHLPRWSESFGEEMVAGTLEYMAPEQAQGRKLDGRADLYALGVIAFEGLAGVRPLRLRGADILEQLQDLLRRPAPPLPDFRPGVDPQVAGLVGRLLAKKPRHRPDSARAVAEELRQIVDASAG